MKQNPGIKYGIIGAVLLLLVGIIIQLLIFSYLKNIANTPEKFSIGKFLLFSILSLVIICGIFIFSIVKSMKDYRILDPEYNYRKLVGQGLIATLILVLLSTGFNYLYTDVISPETKAKTIELTKQIYQQLDIPDDQKQKALDSLNNQDPVRSLLSSLGLTLLLGMIVSLISANVLNIRNRMNNPNQLR